MASEAIITEELICKAAEQLAAEGMLTPAYDGIATVFATRTADELP